MEKEATDLLRLALLGLLTGGGAYAGGRLISDMGRAASKPEKPKDELEITLPSSRLPKVANDEATTATDHLLKLLAFGGGATGGFVGASHLYDKFRQSQIKTQQQKVEDNYLKTLQQAHQKVAETQTPLIDQFLEGILSKTGEELQKQSFDLHALKESLNTPIHSESLSTFAKTQGGNLMEGAANSGLGSSAIAAWLVGTLGAGGATYAIANRLDKQKQQSKAQTTLPQEINLRVHG